MHHSEKLKKNPWPNEMVSLFFDIVINKCVFKMDESTYRGIYMESQLLLKKVFLNSRVSAWMSHVFTATYTAEPVGSLGSLEAVVAGGGDIGGHTGT